MNWQTFDISRSTLSHDKTLLSLEAEHKMYVHSDQRTRTQTPDPNAPLYFVIPKQWHKQALDMQGTQRSQYQVVKNNLKTLIVQHLVQIGAKKSAFTCSIEEKPRLHAKLLFAENSAKERSLILENSAWHNK
jgi:hypothetical protein